MSGLDNSIRILRAIEGEGEARKTEDFPVHAVFLRASEALEPMSGSSDVLTSEDNVIALHDSIASIKALAGWLTRDKSFQIDDANMKDLAHLSDKYIIDSLRKDIRNYALIAVWRNKKMTFADWKFAARYDLLEVEEYCRTAPINRLVFVVLKDILHRPQGVEAFYQFGVTPRVMSRVVAGMVRQMDNLRTVGGELLSDSSRCLGCFPRPGSVVVTSLAEGVCDGCRKLCFDSLTTLTGPDLR